LPTGKVSAPAPDFSSTPLPAIGPASTRVPLAGAASNFPPSIVRPPAKLTAPVRLKVPSPALVSVEPALPSSKVAVSVRPAATVQVWFAPSCVVQ